MTKRKFFVLYVSILLSGSIHAQLVKPMPPHVLSKDASAISTSLFVPDSNVIMLFRQNKCYWYSTTGHLLRGPVVIRDDGEDIRLPRISSSGKIIFFYHPGEDFLSDNVLGLYNQDSANIIGTYKIPSGAKLDKVRFMGDSILNIYTTYDEFKGNYTWNVARGTVNHQSLREDSLQTGLYDRAYYKDQVFLAMRHKDSMALITANIGTAVNQYFDFFKLSSNNVKLNGQFSQDYPYFLMGDESMGATKIFRAGDSSFTLVATLPLLPEIISASGTPNNCYILFKDTSDLHHPLLKIFDVAHNSSTTLPFDATTSENEIFNIYPSKNLITVSQVVNGNIVAYDFSNKEIAWRFSPESIETNTAEQSPVNAPDNKLFKVLIKQGSQDIFKSYFNQELNQLFLIKNKDKLITVDADSKCAMRWESFYRGDERIEDAELLPGYRYILYTEERWKKDPTATKKDYMGKIEYDADANRNKYIYPYAYKVHDRTQAKTIFTLQAADKTDLHIINDSLISWPEYGNEYREDSVNIYNLNTGALIRIKPLKNTPIYGYSVAMINKRLYYFLELADQKIVLVNDKGQIIYSRNYSGEDNLLHKISFVKNAAYFYSHDNDKKAINQLFRITDDSVQAVRKFPAAISIVAYRNTSTGCYFMYKKEVQRKKENVFHYRFINMLTGQDKLIDSVKSDEDASFGNFDIFPDDNFYTFNDNNIISWHDLNNGYEFKNFGRDEPSLSSIAYSPDGRYLASANPNGKVLLWDLGTGKETKSLAVEKSGYITKLAFSGDGQYLAASSGDIWETATGKNIVSVTDGSIWAVNSIDFSMDGKRIVSGGACIISWDASDGSKIYFQQEPAQKDMDTTGTCWNPNGCVDPAFKFMVHCVALHPNSRDFVAGNKKGLIQKWNTENDSLYAFKFLANIAGQTDDKVYDLKYSRDGKSIIALQQKCIYRLNANTLEVEDSILLPETEQVLGIDMGYDGKQFGCIAQRLHDRIVQIRNIGDLSLQQEFYTDGASFNKISFSPNKKHAATASDDGFCTIWDIASGKPVMYLNTIGEYGNIMVTPDNYYMASRSALEGVNFFKDSSFYSFDQFDLYLNRPDIVLNRLGYAAPELVNFYRNAYFKRLKKITGNTTDTVVNNTVPSLKLVNKKLIAIVSQSGVLKLAFAIRDSLCKNGALRISINGSLVKNQSIALHNNETFIYEDSVLLSQGINNIEAVYNNCSSLESRKEKIAVSYSPSKKTAPKVWFVGVGISRYKDPSMNLKYPVKDIRDIAVDFKKKYPSLIIDTILNEKATKGNLLALHDKLMKTGIDDKVIVSFSGHGLLSDSLDWYFATHDIDFKKPELLGLSYEMMEGILDGIPARQKLLLMDACHSGEVDKESDITFENKETALEQNVVNVTGNARGNIVLNKPKAGLQTSFEMMQEMFANLNNGNGTTVLSAAGGTEYALESDQWKNGVFTYSLLKALKNPATDENGDKKISVRELKKSVFTAVKTLTGGRQKPTSRVEALDDWNIW